jgi:HEPN domain-containing protein
MSGSRDDAAIWAVVGEWIRSAELDRRAMAACLALDPPVPEVAAFHCQQAAEKLLKGFLVLAQRRFRRTHDLEELGGIVPEETAAVGRWIAARLKDGLQPHEIGVFVRSERELERARAAVAEAAVPSILLSDKVETAVGHVSIGTMHLAKGLEFRAVAVMACDEYTIPSQERIENVADDADLEDVYDTERHLLYVACTRARDHLLVTGIEAASEFLDDFVNGEQPN